MYDLQTAALQGGILEIDLGHASYGEKWNPEIETEELSTMQQAAASINNSAPEAGRFLIISGSIFLVLGFVALGSAIRWVRNRRTEFHQIHLSEPLM
jgi:hypothetical protein